MPADTLYNDVFISYSRKDDQFARRVVDALQDSGRDSWIDWGDLSTGSRWWGEIQGGIEAADNFVFLVTPESLASPVCHLEIAHARSQGKRIVPAIHVDPQIETALGRIAAVKPDDTLEAMLAGRDILLIARDNWRVLSEINWLFFRDEDDCQKSFNQLVKTIETDQTHVKTHTRLFLRAKEWDEANRDPAKLLRGDDLRDAEIWLAASEGKSPPPTDLHSAYITASTEQSQRDAIAERKRVQLLRGLSVGLGLLAIVLVVVAYGAVGSQNHALAESTRAANNLATSDANAARAVNNLATSDANAALAATQAFRANNNAATSDANAALAVTQAFRANNNAATSDGNATLAANNLATSDANLATSNALGTQSAENLGQAQSLAWAAYAQERYQAGDTLLALSLAMEANRIPNPPLLARDALAEIGYDSGIRKHLRGHTQAVADVIFNPDGKTALSASSDGTLILWDVASGQAIRTFTGYTSGITRVAFSPDRQTILSALDDNTLILWDVASGQAIRTFTGHTEMICDIASSLDGKMVLAGSRDDTLILWDVASGQPIRIFHGDIDEVTIMGFSPDGKMALSASWDNNTLILWDWQAARPSAPLRGIPLG